jgi:pyruvate kinase
MIKLIDAGMTLARFNLSHGTAKVSDFLESASQENRSQAIIM